MIDSKTKRAIAARTMIPINIGNILFWLAHIVDGGGGGYMMFLTIIFKEKFICLNRAGNVYVQVKHYP